MNQSADFFANNKGASQMKISRPDKFVYFFSAGETDGNASMKNILGGKGANLAEMTAIGLDVPPGFTISTDICSHFYAEGAKLPDWVKPKALESLKRIEKKGDIFSGVLDKGVHIGKCLKQLK